MIPKLVLNKHEVPLNHLGLVWYHSEPASDDPHSPNQFLGWDFFCCFLQQDSSNQWDYIDEKTTTTKKVSFWLVKNLVKIRIWGFGTSWKLVVSISIVYLPSPRLCCRAILALGTCLNLSAWPRSWRQSSVHWAKPKITKLSISNTVYLLGQ